MNRMVDRFFVTFRSGILFGVPIVPIWIISSCASKKIIVPPATDTTTGVYHVGHLVWHDLLTDQLSEVKKFYGELFGWEFVGDSAADAPSTLIRYDGNPIGGILYTDMKKGINESQWLSYLSVPDVDAAVA